MKSYLITLIISLLITLSSLSCKNSFSPNVNFNKQYALNCIIRGDTTLQFATVTQSFSKEDFNNESAFVPNAILKLNYDGQDYFFNDTTSVNPNNISYYYLKDLKLKEGKKIEIEADLPDGKVLKSSTQTPDVGKFVFDGDKNIPAKNYSNLISVNWSLPFYYGPDFYYRPYLYIVYKKKVNDTLMNLQREVPIEYNLEGDKYVPVYPDINKTNSISYSLEVINKTLLELSAKDSVDINSIVNAKFLVWILDDNLAKYISSSKTFQDGFSINIEAPDFTNVEGGYGIFGSFLTRETIIQIDRGYLKSIGL